MRTARANVSDFYEPHSCRFQCRHPDYMHLRFDDRLVPEAKRRELDLHAIRRWINQDWASVQLMSEVGRQRRRLEQAT